MSHGSDHIFEAWAHWCEAGKIRTKNGTSMIAQLIESKGHLTFGGSPFASNLDCIEAKVEAALMQLFITDPTSVEVVRFEYIYSIIYIDEGDAINQKKKAIKLGLTLRTYQRRLSKGRNYVFKKLEKKRK